VNEPSHLPNGGRSPTCSARLVDATHPQYGAMADGSASDEWPWSARARFDDRG
jgi:hypothetical protein